MRKTVKFGAHAARTEPTRMVARDTCSSRFLCGPSLNRPMIGVATAPTSRLMVSIHCAELTDTDSSSAMVGTSSMPRELTIALVRAV